MTMKKDVMLVTGAGQIGMAIARRVGFGKNIILGDKSMKLEATGGTVEGNAGYRANAAVEDGATVNVTVTLTA